MFLRLLKADGERYVRFFPSTLLLRPGEDQLHYALGLGIAFENFQIDGALDLSDTVNTASLSIIFSF